MRKKHHEDLQRIKKLVQRGDSKRDILIEIHKMFYEQEFEPGDQCVLTEGNGVHDVGHRFTLIALDKQKNDAVYADEDAERLVHNCFQWFRKLDPEEIT